MPAQDCRFRISPIPTEYQHGSYLFVGTGTGCRCSAPVVCDNSPSCIHTDISSAQAGLNTAAKAAGLKYFGTAVDNPGLEDKAYVKQTSNTDDFGQITPANGQKVFHLLSGIWHG